MGVPESARKKLYCTIHCLETRHAMPNTHRRRRRDSNVELSRVGRCQLNSQLVHDGFSRKIEN